MAKQMPETVAERVWTKREWARAREQAAAEDMGLAYGQLFAAVEAYRLTVAKYRIPRVTAKAMRIWVTTAVQDILGMIEDAEAAQRRARKRI